MTKAQIKTIEERLDAIDIRLGKGSTHFKWLIGLWSAQVALLLLVLGLS